MTKSTNEGGYEGGKKDGVVRFSERTLRYYWPNWLVQMNDSHKQMCGCETCTTMNDLHTAMKAKRTRLISAASNFLNEMDDGPDKEKFEKELEEYKNEVLNNGGTRHKHEDGMAAAEEYGCGEKIEIDGCSYPHFSCVLLKCDQCTKDDYQAPKFELEQDDDEIIRYTRFTTHTRCYAHGSLHLMSYDTRPYVRCSICETLSEEEKKALKAKIQTIKMRTLHKELLSKFVSKEGTYATQLKKMFSHKYRVILSGKKRKGKTRLEHARKRRRTIKTEQDFSERASFEPNGQAQFEYFNKDESLGIEGISVYFKPKGQDHFVTRLYSILSTEKAQDGNVVYANIRMMLSQLLEDIEGGLDVVGVDMTEGLLEILSDTDGCSCQYRSGTALFLLHKLATELNIIYDRSIDVEGHGKRLIDGWNGNSRACCSKAFRGDVEYQPEALVPGKKSVLLYKMSEGERVDLADICCKILSAADRRSGVERVAPVKPRKEKEHYDMALDSRHYMVRKVGTAKWDKLSKQAMGFPSGKGNGIKAHYNFRFEKALGDKYVFRRIACSCDGCYEQLQEPTIERYTRASNSCYWWPIMEKKDGSGKGWNDWGLGWFENKKDATMEDTHAANADTLRQLGETISKEIEVGNIGAYSVDDPEYNYYLVRWDEEPQVADADKTFELGGDKVVVYKGDWYCKGTWLQKVKGAKNWWTKHGQQCVVRLETVLNADVMILPRSDENRISSWGRLYRTTKSYVEEHGAWRVSDTDDSFMVEESRMRSAWEYDEELVRSVRDELVAAEEVWTNIAIGHDNESDEE